MAASDMMDDGQDAIEKRLHGVEPMRTATRIGILGAEIVNNALGTRFQALSQIGKNHLHM